MAIIGGSGKPYTPVIQGAIHGGRPPGGFQYHRPIIQDPDPDYSGSMHPGRPAPQASNPASSAGAKQAFLIAHGYHITHDGIMGPQTANAWNAYHTGIGANHWNAASPHSNTSHAPAPPPAAHGGFHGGGGGGGGFHGGGGGGGHGGGGAGGGGFGSLGNPSKQAAAMTNLQYGALLSALHSNITNLTGQNAQNLSDIHDWFGHAQATAQAGTAADQTAGTQAQAQNQQDFSGLLNALGGNTQAAPMVGGMHAANQTLLQALAQNQQGFDNTAQTNLGAESATASQNQLNAGNSAVQALQDKLTQALADKGNAGVVNLASARQQRLQMMAELQNMSLAGKQFNMNQALGMADLQNKNLNNSILYKQAKQMSNGGKVAWNQIGSGDRLKLQQSVMPLMYGPKGETTNTPQQAWVRAANQLRAAGYDATKLPGLRAWLSQSWMNYVGDWNKAHPTTPYKPYKNGTPYAKW